jgi:hypothetical protein
MISSPSDAWFDNTHLSIAKAAGYQKWYNAAAPDVAKIKAGKVEENNHYVNNPPNTIITPEMVLSQVERYNDSDDINGHLYGAIIASVRDYFKDKQLGKYGEYHLAYCSHYVGDLSMPLHNTLYNSFNKKYHAVFDGIIDNEVLDNIHRIKLYKIMINNEQDLASEIARIANISLKLGYKLQREDKVLKEEDAFEQISHSASLFKAILEYIRMNI